MTTVTRDAEGTVTGNTYDKYGSTNPVVRRLMAGFERTLAELLAQAGPRSILDVGCGEGVLVHKWAHAHPEARIVGIDLEAPDIQAGKMTVAVEHVPVRTNPKLRESRLFPSMWTYIRRNGISIFRIYALYEPLRVFMTAALIVGLAALAVWTRFLVAFIGGNGAGHVQSLILGAVLFNAAMVLAALGVLGDLLSGQRITLQRIFERVRRVELELGVPPSHYEPGAETTGQEPTTGARAGRPGRTEEREALRL